MVKKESPKKHIWYGHLVHLPRVCLIYSSPETCELGTQDISVKEENKEWVFNPDAVILGAQSPHYSIPSREHFFSEHHCPLFPRSLLSLWGWQGSLFDQTPLCLTLNSAQRAPTTGHALKSPTLAIALLSQAILHPTFFLNILSISSNSLSIGLVSFNC